MTREEYKQLVATVREEVTSNFEEKLVEALNSSEFGELQWASIIALLTVRSDEFVTSLVGRLIQFED